MRLLEFGKIPPDGQAVRVVNLSGIAALLRNLGLTVQRDTGTKYRGKFKVIMAKNEVEKVSMEFHKVLPPAKCPLP